MNAPGNPLFDAVRQALAERCGIGGEDRLLVAVSGGADSVFLLHALCALGYSCVVAHVNHQLRGTASEADAAFVEALAKDHGLECKVLTVDVEGRAGETGESIEMAARELRYDALAKAAKVCGATAIVTGHHGGDQAETVLMRILRGTSPKGLLGIPARGAWNGVPVLRPMLALRREAIHHYLRACGIPYRSDASNENAAHLRNRLRHDLLPRLERDYNPRATDALRRLASEMEVENAFVASEAEVFLDRCRLGEHLIDRDAFRRAHVALQCRALATLLRDCGVDVDHDHVADAARFICGADAGKRFDVGGGTAIVNGQRESRIEMGEIAAERPEPIALTVPGIVRGYGRRFEANVLADQPVDLKRYCNACRQVFDLDAVGSELTIRTARAGDRFRPLGLGGSKLVSDYLAEIGVPVWRRNSYPVIESQGRIIWIVGGALSDEAAVRGDTKRVFEICVCGEEQQCETE